jgi:hypothetical protein
MRARSSVEFQYEIEETPIHDKWYSLTKLQISGKRKCERGFPEMESKPEAAYENKKGGVENSSLRTP